MTWTIFPVFVLIFAPCYTVERLRAADNVDQFAGNGSLPRFIV